MAVNICLAKVFSKILNFSYNQVMFPLFLLIFLFHNAACIINSGAGGFDKISDNSSIVLSLENLNISSTEGDSFDSLYVLPPYSTSEIILTKVPPDVFFVVLQVHSYLVNITLSLYSKILQGNSITGTNVGLLKMYKKTDLSFYLTYKSSSDDVNVLISVQAYSKNAPIPGGCNMEFPVEISPFLLTTYNEAITTVNFAPSAPPLSASSQPFLFPGTECNIKPSPVHHEMYHQYFPERDFTKDTYFNVLKSMMTKGRILKNAMWVPEKLGFLAHTKKLFATYPGTGRAFVVISNFENYSSVYVPSFTYGCNDLAEDNTCVVLTTPFSRLLCATVLFLGLFCCFFGHYFFKIEIFLFGFLASGIVTYICVSILYTNEIALSASVSLGVLTALIMLIAWTIFGLPIISVTLTSVTFGFLLASMVLHPITDLVDLLVSDITYWGIFIGIAVSCPFIMTPMAEKANIISCLFWGSYVSIVSIDHYIGSNLRYVVINTIRRAVIDDFKYAITHPPFQSKDMALCVVWIVLICLGVAIQHKLLENKPPYPPPVNPLKNLFKKWKKPSQLKNSPSEKTPLLPDLSTNTSPILTTSNYGHYDGN